MRTLTVMFLVLAVSACVRTVVVAPLDNPGVRGFVAHADREWPGTPQQQTLTVDTLDWLATAVQSLATTRQVASAEFPKQLQEFRATLKEFAAGDPSQLQQTAVLERLFTQSATLVSAVSDTVNDDELREQLSSVKTAAAALDSDRLPREQPDTIERFFRETSIALQRIDRAS